MSWQGTFFLCRPIAAVLIIQITDIGYCAKLKKLMADIQTNLINQDFWFFIKFKGVNRPTMLMK